MGHVASNLGAFPCNVKALWTIKRVLHFNHEPTRYGVKANLPLVQTMNLE